MPTPDDDPRIARGMTEQFAARRKRIEAGDKPLGWKVGFGAPAAKEKFRIAAPLVGYLMQSGLMPSGASVSLAGWTKPVAEPEIAVHIGADVAPGGSRADAAKAITALGPAIELADATLPFDDPEAILKANIFQRHVVIGPRDAGRAGGRLDGLLGRFVRRGAQAAQTADLEANTGPILDTVRHVADLLPAFGERLRAGDVIIAGSVVAPALIEPDETELAFHLDPVGSVAVRFARG